MENSINIALVVVLYKTNILECQTYKTLLYNCNWPVLIYDNSPTPQKIALPKHFEYRHNPQNPGVSTAYNDAINWAKTNGSTHLLLLDSDSTFPDVALKSYHENALLDPKTLILPEMISAKQKISPFYFKWGKTWYGNDIKTGNIKLGNILAINSGMLVPLSLVEKINGFNPKIPLDFSDLDFVYRLSKICKTALHIPLQVKHGLSEHEKPALNTAKLRFNTYLTGITFVSVTPTTKLLMWYWAKLKAIKLSLQHRDFYFFKTYLKIFFSGK